MCVVSNIPEIPENCIVIQRKRRELARKIFVMRCKHPIFNVTRFQLQTPGGRASHPDLHPSETKALTDGSQLPYEPVGGTDMTKFLPPFQ